MLIPESWGGMGNGKRVPELTRALREETPRPDPWLSLQTRGAPGPQTNQPTRANKLESCRFVSQQLSRAPLIQPPYPGSPGSYSRTG